MTEPHRFLHVAMASADTSCVVRRNEGGKGDYSVLETVARIGSKLASEEGGGEAAVVESLRELQGVRMTFEVLETTKIGRAVNVLRKTAPSEQTRRLAAAIYTGWKALADERLKGSSSPPTPPVDAKQSAQPEGELKMARTSLVVEATPETKLHHHDVFDSAAIVKKPESLPVINTTNAPGKAEQPQRRVTVIIRRTAAAPNTAPASKSNAASRNGGGPNSNQQAKCPATASQQGTTNAEAKRVSPTSTAPLTTVKPPTATPLPKPVVGSSGACKRKADGPAVFDEERLARASARLREGYKEIEAAKEKRKIKKIKAIDALGKMARQRPALQVRCTAAQRTGKQAGPVPCPPRMPRAF